jgi:hypothetical protein
MCTNKVSYIQSERQDLIGRYRRFERSEAMSATKVEASKRRFEHSQPGSGSFPQERRLKGRRLATSEPIPKVVYILGGIELLFLGETTTPPGSLARTYVCVVDDDGQDLNSPRTIEDTNVSCISALSEAEI